MLRDANVLVTGWPSFLHGEATAGDVLAMEAVRQALAAAGIRCELAWSPVLRPGLLTLAAAEPGRYTHLVFACGPVHGWQVRELHTRYANCRRIAVGVSVIDPADPAVTGFHAVLPRDGAGTPGRRDLAAQVQVPGLPVVGVILAPGQPEYAGRRRHEQVEAELAAWLTAQDCARLPLDTRLDSRDWRHPATPAQLEAVIARLDLVLTTRLHGLVLGLKNAVPVLAVDPVAGGAKVTAQARAWGWPAIITLAAAGTRRDGLSGGPAAGRGPVPVPVPVLDRAKLSLQWQWCRSAAAAAAARTASAGDSAGDSAPSLTGELLAALAGPLPGAGRILPAALTG